MEELFPKVVFEVFGLPIRDTVIATWVVMAIIMGMPYVAAVIATPEASAKMRFIIVYFFVLKVLVLPTKFLSFQLPKIPNYYGLFRAQKRSILTKIDVSNLFFGGTEKIVGLKFCLNHLRIPT